MGRVVDACTGVFVTAMVAVMLAIPGEETIPYHLLFLCLTLVYGFRVWPLRPTLLVVATVTVVTGAIMYDHVEDGSIDVPELAEVPLMPLLLLAMIWHARRRAAAQRQVEDMAEERQRSLQREREFLRDSSHAIRTPVTIARGHMELIQAGLSDPEAIEDSQVVLRQLDRMCALSSRLLALARLDSAQPLRLAPLSLDAFTAQTVANWRGGADRCWAAEAHSTAVVRADPDWLELAVDALVENAVHFTGPGDRITLSATRSSGMGVLTVADSGHGIAAEDLPHVFERFWHRRPPDGAPGSGLGLSMAQAAIQGMGGKLTVTSTLGIGTRFALSLPLDS
jgi:signal transduction histidine kinase